jgi:membrane protein DedA with SNARE-associated domain
MQHIHQFFDIVAQIASTLGYIGVFIGMAIESSFVPMPSEIIMIPAGIAAQKGEMNLYIVIFFGTMGSLFGAYVNYFLAYKFGRKFFGVNSKVPFVKKIDLAKIEEYFKRRGEISIFIGRLLPVIRQYISIPAGLAKMNFGKFSFYTLAGSLIWVSILSFGGYYGVEFFSF